MSWKRGDKRKMEKGKNEKEIEEDQGRSADVLRQIVFTVTHFSKNEGV